MTTRLFDNSQISQYQKCPFSYYLQYIVGLKMKDEQIMQQGSDIHALLESYYKHEDMRIDEPEYTFLLNSYDEKYKDDNFKVLATEKPVKFQIFGKDFVVKLDTVVGSNKNIFGLEHKTTARSSLTDDWFKKFKMSGQMDAQIFAIEKEFGVCNGIIVNGIAIKNLKRKPTSKAYYGWKEFDGRFCALEFGRDIVNKKTDKIAEWYDNAFYWINQINSSISTNMWAKSTSAMGGTTCTYCDYCDLCKHSIDKELDESIIEMYYERVDDPLGYLKEKTDG